MPVSTLKTKLNNINNPSPNPLPLERAYNVALIAAFKSR
jgi:hypothetical protein